MSLCERYSLRGVASLFALVLFFLVPKAHGAPKFDATPFYGLTIPESDLDVDIATVDESQHPDHWTRGSTAHQPLKRELSMSAAICKGNLLLQKLNPNNLDPSLASQWTSYNDLDSWGWRQGLNQDGNNFKSNDADAFQGLGIQSNNLIITCWFHQAQTTHDGVYYEPTGGEYFNIYDVEDQTIIAEHNFSPSYMDGSAVPPLLKQWSDVVFLEWQSQAGDNVKDLKNVLRVNIVNPDTVTIIDQALESVGKSLTPWPGTTFTTSSDQGKAILATPNAGGVAWLLINHKAQMGPRTIPSVTVWMSDGMCDVDYASGMQTVPCHNIAITIA